MSTRPIGSPIRPCVWFDDQAEAAADLYLRAFPGAHIRGTSRYPESGPNPGGRPPGSVLTVDPELAGQRFTLLNGGPMFRPNPSISFFVHADTPAEVDRLYEVLMEGGAALMPLGAYPWSERYAWIEDRFGVSWQLIAGRRQSAAIVPCLMFVGAQHGRAEEAMRFYTAALGGHIDAVEHYGPGEGPAHTVKHGRFVVAGQELVAMDGHGAHEFAFDEGLSLQVMCEGQGAVDRTWAALTDGGQPGPCGWLQDRFGLSWQVVPTELDRWLTHEDPAARDRGFQAMLGMGKIDIEGIRRAVEGG